MINIPIVDLSGLDAEDVTENSKQADKNIIMELHSAFSTVGFVYLKNHGVEQRWIDKVFQTSKKFFELPQAVKERYKIDPEHPDGYTGKDQEILDVTSTHEYREAYDVACDNGTFPDEHVPGFHAAVSNLAPHLNKLTTALLKCMALGLGLERDYFSSRHKFMFQGAGKNRTIFRSLYYPTLSNEDITPGVIRCGAHSDYGAITLLFQDEMGGLEIFSRGKWIPAIPISGTVLVNLGDLMQFWTADRYVATVHRVIIPKEEIRRRMPRQSIAYFVHADNGVMVYPIDGSDKHPPVEALEYLKSRIYATYK